MSNIILHADEVSPPCRAVLLTAEALGIKLQIHTIKLVEKQTLTKEFSKINPQHTVPTLNDNGFILWDSHAIMCYLVGKYGKNDSLYPKDLQKRALIDQRLHFDSGILFALLRGIAAPIFYKGATSIDPEKIELLKDAYDFLNKFLEGKKWLVGDNYTLADISCVTSLASLDAFHPFSEYPNVVRWLKTCEEEIPAYKRINEPGDKIFHNVFAQMLPSSL